MCYKVLDIFFLGAEGLSCSLCVLYEDLGRQAPLT
jgi:hypothetical protein